MAGRTNAEILSYISWFLQGGLRRDEEEDVMELVVCDEEGQVVISKSSDVLASHIMVCFMRCLNKTVFLIGNRIINWIMR